MALTDSPAFPPPLLPLAHQAYEDDFDEDEDEQEDDYGDDDFEEDDEPPTPHRAPAPPPAAEPRYETELQRAMREENERALRESAASGAAARASANAPRGGTGALAADPPTSVFAVAEGTSARVVRGFPAGAKPSSGGVSSGRKPLTDAQRVKAAARLARWSQVSAAVRMTSKGAGCGTDGLFILDPMTPAQMRDRGVGPHARGAHATTQTMDEAAARDFECQTDSVAARAVAAQSPEDLSVSRAALEATAGGAIASAASAALARRRAAAQRATEWARATGDLQHSKERRCSAFVARAAALAHAHLRERDANRLGDGSGVDIARAGGRLKPHASQGQPGSLTSSYLALCDDALTAGRVATAAAFGSAGAGSGATSLLVAYGPRAGARRGRAARGQILVWDLAAPVPAVTRAMTLEGTPTRVAWAGARDRFVVCGTEDGALCAWDLDEDQRGDPAHSRAEEDPDSEEEGEASDTAAPAFARRAPGILRGQMHRRPSYTTEGSSFAARGDVAGAVVALAVVAETTPRRATAEATESASAGDAERRRDDAARSGSARPGGFHVLALDCWGRADSYLASEVSERDAADAAVSDPGLRFGSRLRLVPAALDVKYGGTEGARARGCGRCHDARAAPEGAGSAASRSHFFVAAETGAVLRGARYGTASAPRAYLRADAADAGGSAGIPSAGAAATSIDFNPCFPDAFLVGYADGGAALFFVGASLPAARWGPGATKDGSRVVAVRWSPSRPSSFHVLDEARHVTTFDLLSPKPDVATQGPEAFGKRERITAFEVRKLGGGGWEARGATLACMAYDDGRTDVHEIAPGFCAFGEAEYEALRAVLDDARGGARR